MNRCVSFERLEWMLGRTDGEQRQALWREEYRMRERAVVRRAITQLLTPVQRETVLLYYYQGMTMPQIAQLRGCNKSNVCRTLKRARGNLMRALQYLPSLNGEVGEEAE